MTVLEIDAFKTQIVAHATLAYNYRVVDVVSHVRPKKNLFEKFAHASLSQTPDDNPIMRAVKHSALW